MLNEKQERGYNAAQIVAYISMIFTLVARVMVIVAGVILLGDDTLQCSGSQYILLR